MQIGLKFASELLIIKLSILNIKFRIVNSKHKVSKHNVFAVKNDL